jgi:VanZ family protein
LYLSVKLCQTTPDSAFLSRLKLRKFFIYWLPMLLWMLVIFTASGDQMSFQHTSRIIEPFLHWLLPSLTQETAHAVVVLVRKAAHVSEYSVLTVLVWRLVDSYRPTSDRTNTWANTRLTLLVVVLYAASDEFHQYFVPSREASIRDVLIDSCGAIFALIFIHVAARWKRQRLTPAQPGSLTRA